MHITGMERIIIYDRYLMWGCLAMDMIQGSRYASGWKTIERKEETAAAKKPDIKSNMSSYCSGWKNIRIEANDKGDKKASVNKR